MPSWLKRPFSGLGWLYHSFDNWLCDEQAVLILRHSVAGFQWRGEPTHSPASISDVHKATCMWFFIPVLQLYLLLHTSS